MSDAIETAQEQRGDVALLNVARLLGQEQPTSVLVDGIVHLRAARQALGHAEDLLRELVTRRARAVREREGIKWRAPVPGVANAALPEPEPKLEVDDHGALASWLRKHHPAAYQLAVLADPMVEVEHTQRAHAALERIHQADLDDDDTTDDTIVGAALDLTRALNWWTEYTVDLAALTGVEGWGDVDTEGLPVSPDGERVPHVSITPGQPAKRITVTPDQRRLLALTTAYRHALGAPLQLPEEPT